MTDDDQVLKECESLSKEYNFFNVLELKREVESGPLLGTYFSIKDCIVVKDMESRSGSRILSGYKPVFNASVVENILKKGGTIIGKTSQDEFGFGSFNKNVGKGFAIPLNPHDKERVCGGSSGGCAGLTSKAKFKHISIAESTGGSIVCPASFCGVLGLCPTYGLVSRYGLMDYANSLDKIGLMAKNAQLLSIGLDAIAFHDKRDSTSVLKKKEEYAKNLSNDVNKLRVGVIKDAFESGTDKEVQRTVFEKIEMFKSAGVHVEDVSLPITRTYSLPTYYLIAMSETSTNLAKYCGIRYGKHEVLEGNYNEYFSKVRGMHFGDEAKRRIIIGTFARMSGFRDHFYIKALRARTKIIEEYKAVFDKFDILICPTMPIVAPKIEETKSLTPLQNYMLDILTVGPNLAGLPHISVPAGISELEGMPIGMMMISDHFCEQKLLNAAKFLEK